MGTPRALRDGGTPSQNLRQACSWIVVGVGVLLHPTSLPSLFGIGDLGPAASDFLDFLARARQTLWQVLPLGPTGFGDSPYASPSAFAGNPLLISPDQRSRTA